MKLLVEGEISATSYKKLVARLKNFSKKQLWEILDHYLFHVMDDGQVIELLNILDERALVEQNQEQVPVAASADDNDFLFTVDPVMRFRSGVINTVPSMDSLKATKDKIYLYYDQHCLESYVAPEIRADVARQLIAFANDEGIPVEEHWVDFSLE